MPSRSEAEQVIEDRHTRCSALPMQAEGDPMRWAISMHLAVGYATLIWDNPDEAKAAFAAILPYRDRSHTWPRAVGNIGIDMFMAGWLA